MGAVVAAGLLVVGFFVASALVALGALIGVGAYLWLWWRGRNKRSHSGGAVIEGEYRVEHTPERKD